MGISRADVCRGSCSGLLDLMASLVMFSRRVQSNWLMRSPTSTHHRSRVTGPSLETQQVHWAHHHLYRKRDRERKRDKEVERKNCLCKVDYDFSIFISISFNRTVYLWTHNIRIWPLLPLLMFIHMSTRLLAELISAYQMAPQTIGMRIFCQPLEKLLYKHPNWHH